MPAALASRRALLRLLYEQYHVPLDLLADAANYEAASVRSFAASEGWRGARSAGALRAQLANLLERTIDAHDDAEADPVATDRAVKNIVALSKAIESFAACEAPNLNAAGQTGPQPRDDTPSLAVGEGALIAQLDQLAASLARQIDTGAAPGHADMAETVLSATVADDGTGRPAQG